MSFQTQVNNQPALGIEGDWASANPRSSSLASAGGFIAGPAGVTVGRFAWADADGIVRSSGGNGRIGFVHRDQPSLITAWLGRSTMLVPAGLEVTLFSAADVWGRFALGAVPGQKVYANFLDGSCYAAATGAPPSAASCTGSIAAGPTTAFTGYISPADPVDGAVPGGILTVVTLTSGVIQPGGPVGGSGVSSAQTILSQISGTVGGVGSYEVSVSQTVGSAAAPVALTETYGTFTAASGLTGTFAIGDLLTGASAGTQITAFGTGLGGLGTYIVNNTQTVASTTIGAVGGVETIFYVDTFAAPGELAKIGTHI